VHLGSLRGVWVGHSLARGTLDAHSTDRGHRFTLIADGVQQVSALGIQHIAGSAMVVKPPVLSTPTSIAGAGNVEPRAMLV